MSNYMTYKTKASVTINIHVLHVHSDHSPRASSPVWASQVSLARTRERGAEERTACNDLS